MHAMSDASPDPAPPVADTARAFSLPESKSAAKTVRSLGWEIHRLRLAARLLAARVRNETLSEALLAFLEPLMPAIDTPLLRREPMTLRLSIEGRAVRIARASLHENDVPAPLLGLLHLPGLRAFWVRALRRSHYDRLRRVLPRAWFVTDDPPPGAVVPGLGITSWDHLLDDATLSRVPFLSGEIVLEADEMADAPQLVAHYAAMNGRVTLRDAP